MQIIATCSLWIPLCSSFILRRSELRELCLFMYYGLFNVAVGNLDYELIVSDDLADDQWTGCTEMMWEAAAVAEFEILRRCLLYTLRKTIPQSQPI